MGEASRRRNRRDFTTCAYCGDPATSRDHVPPKCIFVRGRDNLITVPACDAHNGPRSGLDARLLEFLGVFAIQVEPVDRPLWRQASKSLTRSGRDRLLRSSMVHLPDLGGFTASIEAKPFMASIKAIVRGLYWHHAGVCLGLETRVSAGMISPVPQLPMLDFLTLRTVADGQFQYAFGIAEDDPKCSMWFMQFQGNVTVKAFTGAIADERDHE